MDITGKYQKAFDRIKETFSGGSVWRFLLSEVVYEIKSANPKYEWVGIYLVKGDLLVLETFLGKPTEHNKIKLSEGICGASASTQESIIISDVNKDDRYIACDLAVKSEIVVPIVHLDRTIGVIDIDSNQRSVFGKADTDFLENVARLLAQTSPKVHLT